MGWPLAKAIPKATEEAIAEFIYDEIYTHFGAPYEIFTDEGEKLVGWRCTSVFEEDIDAT